MKLEDQVTNLELSKKLKELGVPQESYFSWDFEIDTNKPFITHTQLPRHGMPNMVSAFTVAELGELLPLNEELEKKKLYWEIERGYGYFECRLKRIGLGRLENLDSLEWSDEVYTEANARAKMLIYLIENKLGNYPLTYRK